MFYNTQKKTQRKTSSSFSKGKNTCSVVKHAISSKRINIRSFSMKTRQTAADADWHTTNGARTIYQPLIVFQMMRRNLKTIFFAAGNSIKTLVVAVFIK